LKTGMAAIAVLMLWTAAATARPAKDVTGIGVILGEPTGISAKKWITGKLAFDAAAAWSFSGDNSMHLHADYLIHNFGAVRTDAWTGRLPLYYGLGGRIVLGDHDQSDNDGIWIGVRVPLGISCLFTEAPFDIFAEIVPIFNIIPDTDFDVDAAVGVRYYF
jgi:hypothetical protein